MKNKINKLSIFKFLGIFSFLSLPAFAFAAVEDLGDAIGVVTNLITKSIIPLVFALALAVFLWGVVQYVINSGEEAKKEKAKQFMIWGIIGLTVMVGVWGLVAILGETFDVDTSVIPSLPDQN